VLNATSRDFPAQVNDGSSDNVPGDVGHLNVTFHHNWWADNVNQQMPRGRHGKIHLFNNLFTAAGDAYCTNAGFEARFLVENNIYDGVANPLQVDADSNLLASGNVFKNTTGNASGSGSAFTPPYAYTLEDTAALEASLKAQVGPH
jgi:pectate lyase